MKAYRLFTLIAFSAILTACLEKETDFQTMSPRLPEDGSSGDGITITAIHGPETRTSIEDGGTAVLWSVGDRLRVFNGRGDAEFLSQNEEPVRIAEFQGNLDYFPGDTLIGVYPWRKDASLVDGELYVTLPYCQQGIAGSFADDMNLSVAISTTTSMAFKNVCGGVRFTVSRDDINAVALEGRDEENLAGRLNIGFKDGTPYIKGIEEEAKRILLAPSGRETFEPGKWYYIVLAPVDLSLGVRVTFFTQDGKKGVAESENPLTISRSVFLGKENLDAQVQEWVAEEEYGELEIKEGNLIVEIAEDANQDYVSGLKLSNFYGVYPLSGNSGGGGNHAPRKVGSRKAPDGVVYNRFTTPFGYVWGNYMLNYIVDQSNEVVMCCLSQPTDETVISAESTAIGLLMSSYYLVTDNPEEIDFIIDDLHTLPEFSSYVNAIQAEINSAMNRCKAPNFTKINKNPVIFALIKKYRPTPDSIDGLDYIDLARDPDNEIISLKIRNHFRRVIHIYGFREYMTEHGTASTKTEPIGLTLQQVLREVNNTGIKKDLSPNSDITEEDLAIARYLLTEFSDIDFDNLPLPYMLEPQSANYWKIVKGALPWWKDTSSPFESTTDLLDFDLKGADNLRLDIYGLGRMERLSSYSNDQLARMLPVVLHGVYVDFITPVINLLTGGKSMFDNAGQNIPREDFKYDLRYGARKAPLTVLIGRLKKNFPESDQQDMWKAFLNGDIGKAFLIPVKYAATEIFGNRNPEGKDTYHNLIYNIFKNATHNQKLPDWFRDDLKALWNDESNVVNTIVGELGLIGATINFSEAGVDLLGAFQAVTHSDFITTFRIPLDTAPRISLDSPSKGTLIHGNKIDFSWVMHRGDLQGGWSFDVDLRFSDGLSSQGKVLRNLTQSELSLNLDDLAQGNIADKLTFTITAHHPDNASQVYATTGPVTVYLADYMKDRGAVDMRLSVQWASTNLGAPRPLDTGSFYGWGETGVLKTTFSWATYQHSQSGTSIVKKYNATDGLMHLLPEDDAVHQLLGGQWRIPSIQEWDELKTQCDWDPVYDNNVRIGYCITSRKNNNYFFLPCSGQKSGNVVYHAGYAKYWSSSREGTFDGAYVPSKARALNEDRYGPNNRSYGSDRCLGMPLRGVLGSGTAQTESSELVDLGLSVKWATCNIGASSPQDPGEYFAWGEIRTKSEYTWATYDFSREANTDMKKYNGTDNLQAADAEEDIVHVRYGGNWRMPTLNELNELRNNCTWQEIKENDVLVAYKIVSKTNYNYIYLPVTGYKQGSELKDEHRAHYWTGTRNDNSYPQKARALNESHFTSYHDGDDRCLGMPVRGVRDDSAASVTATEYVDLGLSVKWASCNIGATAPEYTGNRYSWGSTTSTGGPFTWGSYRFSKNGGTEMNTYNGTDNLQYLKREDDIVYLSHDDARWRTPTIDEWNELKEKCTWTNSTLNGRRGYLITSKVNGKAIFLPIAGYMDNQQLRDGMQSRYWSATRNDNSYPQKARALNEIHFTSYHDGDDRCLGMPVRGVFDESFTRAMLSPGEMVDLGLSVKWASHNLGATVPEEAGKFYAWGELSEKSSYSWATYRFSPNKDTGMSTYNGTDDIQFLKREDDISYRSHTGNGDAYWRTPTIDEWHELQDN